MRKRCFSRILQAAVLLFSTRSVWGSPRRMWKEIMLSGARCYRTLAELNGNLCIIDSCRMMQFDEFKEEVRRLGVTNALYMDMGAGWNYSWYRNAADQLVTLFGLPVPWSHNWIIFQE